MSILNVNQIQPVGGGNTITVSASDISVSGATITASSFVGPLTGAVTGNVTGNLTGAVTGNVTGNLTGNVTGNVTSSSTSTFSSGINVTGGRVLVGTTDAGSNGTADDLVVANNSSASDQAGISIRGGTSGRSQIFFSDGTSGQDEYRGMLRYDHSENSMQFRTDAAERLRIKSDGDVFIGNIAHANDNGVNSNYRTITLADITNGAQLHLRGQSPKLFLDVTSGGNGEIYYDSGDLRILSGEPGTQGSTERLRITNAGIIRCGTSATLKAEINNSVSGHQFISQCSDNNNGFEVYQQHGSNTTRNTFAVYANTGSGNAKNLQFAVRGDGVVTKSGQPLAIIGTTQNNWSPTAGDTLPFNYNNTNRGNHYNTSNYTFTCPVAGDYMVILRLSRKGWCGDLELAKNNSQYARLELRETGRNNSNAADWQAWCYDFIVPCAANDTLKWKAPSVNTGTGGGNYLLDGYNHIYYDSVTYYLMG